MLFVKNVTYCSMDTVMCYAFLDIQVDLYRSAAIFTNGYTNMELQIGNPVI